MSEVFKKLLEARTVSDYDMEAEPPTPEVAGELVRLAAEFLRETRAYLEENGYELAD